MSATGQTRPADHRSVRDALAELCDGFLDAGHCALPAGEVAAADMPAGARQLLDHHEHMTIKLATYHGRKVDLRVLDHRLDGDVYRRKILLALAGTDLVVEFGVMRMNLALVSDTVRREVLERRTPLGAILIQHNVLRRIEPRWFLRFAPHCCQLEPLGVPVDEHAYGRVGTIFCDEEAAIDVLEVITPHRRLQQP